MSTLRQAALSIAQGLPKGDPTRRKLLAAIQREARGMRFRDIPSAQREFKSFGARLAKEITTLRRIGQTYTNADNAYPPNPAKAERAAVQYGKKVVSIVDALLDFGKAIQNAYDTGVFDYDNTVLGSRIFDLVDQARWLKKLREDAEAVIRDPASATPGRLIDKNTWRALDEIMTELANAPR